MVQNALGYVASMAEGIKNTFNFSVPFLSWLAIAILIGVTFVLYFISLRYYRELQSYKILLMIFSSIKELFFSSQVNLILLNLN
jgi:hypothetical protein